MTIYILGALTIILPFLFIAWLSLSAMRSKSEWLLKILLAGSVVLFFYKIGPWSVTSYYLRYLTVAFFLIAALYSFLKVRTLSWSHSGGKWSHLGGIALLALCGIVLSVQTLSGIFCPDNPVKLAFPLGKGSYNILQGGSNGITNPFHAMSEDGKYAIDIIEIGKPGNRATNFLPETLDQYHIFGDAVYSPCSGKVISAVDGLPDNMPPKVDREHTAGNHIFIECKNIKVLLAHLKNGSLKVETGEPVKEGQQIGEVGNSGNSDEPHLHIQANRLDDQPVAILFGDRFASTNDLYVVKCRHSLESRTNRKWLAPNLGYDLEDFAQ